MKKVFATSLEPGAANAIVPVIKALMEENRAEVVVLGHEFSEPIFFKAGIPFKKIQDYGLEDISTPSLEKILFVEKPDLVFTGTGTLKKDNNYVLEQTAILAAKNLGIRSLAVLDYWANYWQRFSDEKIGGRLDCLPNIIAVMDKTAKEEMLAERFPEERLIVTGNPYFDSLPVNARSFDENQKKLIKSKVGAADKPLFFFAGNAFSSLKFNYGFWDMDVLLLIAETLAEFEEIRVVVKPHPRMPQCDRLQIQDFIQSNNRIKLVEDIDSQSLILASDLVLVENSTIGIEAVYMQRPCISLQPGLKISDPLLISRKGIVPVGYSKKECKDLILKSIDPVFRSQILENYSGFTTDGKATGRVVQLIYSLLTE